jgi:hypothetical protein
MWTPSTPAGTVTPAPAPLVPYPPTTTLGTDMDSSYTLDSAKINAVSAAESIRRVGCEFLSRREGVWGLWGCHTWHAAAARSDSRMGAIRGHYHGKSETGLGTC